MKLLASKCASWGFVAAITTTFAFASSAEAFWASHGSYGSYGGRVGFGSYGSAGSYGSGGSYGRTVAYASAGSHGSTGSYGSAGSAASHGSYGSFGSHGSHGPGPLKRLVAHIRAKHAARASAGSHGSTGSAGSHGSTGSHGGWTVSHSSSGSHGSTGSHGGWTTSHSSSSSHGSTGSHGGWTTSHSSAGGWATSATASSSHVVAKPATATGSGMIKVQVPADALVYVNGSKTKATGSQRHYISHGLKTGQAYTYELRVEFQREGEQVTETRSVQLTAGAEQSLAFGNPSPADALVHDDEEDEDGDEEEEQALTKLTLRVPSDAVVTLAGAATMQTGADREFITKQLAPGATWEDYVVRVEAVVDGASVVQERVITLRGGETQAMIFDFDAPKLAAN